MSDVFLGEIRIFGFTFPPKGWAQCNGQLYPISQNTALFSLLGTTYGGNGQSTFGLPNLQGAAPLHPGQGSGLSNRDLGQIGGTPAVTLATPQIPNHTHPVGASSALGTLDDPTANVWAPARLQRQTVNLYADAAGTPVAMSGNTVSAAGGGQPHTNMPPYLVLNFCIALAGIFPSRN